MAESSLCFLAWNSSDCFESFSPLNNWGSNNDSKKSDEIQATCFPICSKFKTFPQNLCTVFGLTLVIQLKFWILPLMAFMSFFCLYLLFYLLRTRLKTNSSSDLEEIFLKSALQFMTQQNWRQFQLRKYLFEKSHDANSHDVLLIWFRLFLFLSFFFRPNLILSYSLDISVPFFPMYLRWFIFWSRHLLFMREVITSN